MPFHAKKVIILYSSMTHMHNRIAVAKQLATPRVATPDGGTTEVH